MFLQTNLRTISKSKNLTGFRTQVRPSHLNFRNQPHVLAPFILGRLLNWETDACRPWELLQFPRNTLTD